MEKWSEEKLEKMLSDSHKSELRASRAIEPLKKPFSILALVGPKEYLEMKDAIISVAGQKFKEIIYITINSSYKKILSGLEKKKIPANGIRFIDMISAHSGIESGESENVIVLDGPSELSECILALEKSLKHLKSKDAVVILDSVSALIVYNDSSSIQKFVHAMLAKINSVGVSAVLLSSDVEEKEEITVTVSQFVDRTQAI